MSIPTTSILATELGPDSELTKALTTALPGKISFPGSEKYIASNGSYFSAFENEITPALIVHPTCAADVATLTKTLKPLLLCWSEHDGIAPKLAIRGRGHAPRPGAANIEGGLTVDMRGLKGVELSCDKRMVSIAAGEDWGAVYEVLAMEGLTAAGGRMSAVGATGFLLGGGLSYFSTVYGFGVDSVTGFEIVLASGEVVQANAAVNEDLYRAVQGGGSNKFGIVTRLEMAVFSHPEKMWGGMVYSTVDNLAKSHQALYDFATAEGDGVDEHAHVMVTAAYAMGLDMVGANLYHTKGVENPTCFKELLDMEPRIDQFTTLRQDTHLGFCREQEAMSFSGKRQFFATATIKPSVELFSAVYERFRADVLAMKDCVAELVFGLVFQPLTKTLLLNSCRQRRPDGAGYNSQGLTVEDGPLIIVLLSSCWAKPSDDKYVFEKVERLVADIQILARSRGLSHRYIFPNYAWTGQDVMSGYGEERLAELRMARERWDPERFFERVVTGGFRLGL